MSDLLPDNPPTPENGYAVDSAMDMTADLFNLIFGSIHERLEAREALEATFESLIAAGTTAALTTINENIAPQLAQIVADAQTALNNIALVTEGVAPNSILLNGEVSSFYLDPANFSISTDIKTFLGAADAAAARTALGVDAAINNAVGSAVEGLLGDAPEEQQTLGDIVTAFTQALDAKLNLAGGTLAGALTLPAGAAGGAPLNIPQGAAPTDPVNGDIWTTGASLVVRLSNSTHTVFHDGNLTEPSESEASAGTSSARRGWTARRVAHAVRTHAPVKLYTGSSSGETNFPIGHHVLVNTLAAARNAAITVRISEFGYDSSGSGAVLAGTWRSRGGLVGFSGVGVLAQRVA